MLKNAEDAECYIRNLLIERAEEDVFVLNLNDDKSKVLDILCYEYPRVKIVNKNDYIDYINNLE